MNQLLSKKKELVMIFICTMIYLICFSLLEKMNFTNYIYTETWIDQYIPFIDLFVVPYVIWFIYIVIGFVYFLIYDTKGLYRTSFYIFIGMYICLLIYWIFPNAQQLRVNLDQSNVFQKVLSLIYHADTSTNVCPSIHVYNSIMMYISLRKNETFKSHKMISISTLILTVLICLSTLFTKQHAFLDLVLALPLCWFIYHVENKVSAKFN